MLDTEDLEVQEDIAESHQAKSRSVMCGDSYIYWYSECEYIAMQLYSLNHAQEQSYRAISLR